MWRADFIRKGIPAFVIAVVLLPGAGCGQPCARLLETVCKDIPDEQHCRNYRTRVSSGHITPEMCEATRNAYLKSVEDERSR